MGSFKLETITPKKAAEYLATSKGNRNIRPLKIAMLKRSIRLGQWRITHQGIAFNCDGSLRDGHHRLTAIADGEVPVKVFVYRGLEDEGLRVVDITSTRNDVDAFRIEGHAGMSNASVATAKVMLLAPRIALTNTPLTRDELLAFIIKHDSAIQFGLRCVMQKNAIHSGVCARAFYHLDENQQERLCDVMRTGICDKSVHGEKSLIRVRDLFQNNRGHVGGSMRCEMYEKAQNGIGAWMNGKDLDKLYRCSDDLFPLPSDE